MTAQEILYERFRNNKMAPLYIIRGPANSTRDFFKQWVYDFCEMIIKDQKSCTPAHARTLRKMGHSDLIIIEKEKEAKEYRQKDQGIYEFNKAHHYPPLEFSHKLIFVMDAQALGQSLANKWLKTLEEPLEKIVTFFIINEQFPLLKTIQSRAITLSLESAQEKKEWLPLQEGVNFQSFLKKYLKDLQIKESEVKELNRYIQSPSPFLLIEYIKGGKERQEILFAALGDYMEYSSTPVHLKEQWLKQLQWFQEAKTFNNAPAQRFMSLIQIIEQCS